MKKKNNEQQLRGDQFLQLIITLSQQKGPRFSFQIDFILFQINLFDDKQQMKFLREK